MASASAAAPTDSNKVQLPPSAVGAGGGGDGVGVKFPSADLGMPKVDKEEKDIIDLKGAGGVAVGGAGGMVRVDKHSSFFSHIPGARLSACTLHNPTYYPTKTTPIWEARKWRIACAGTQNLHHWGAEVAQGRAGRRRGGATMRGRISADTKNHKKKVQFELKF